MFKVVALAYVLFAGQPIDEPYVLASTKSFVDLEACQAYLKSNEFAASRAVLTMVLQSAIRRQQNADTEDGDVAPAVAITASCQSENRI